MDTFSNSHYSVLISNLLNDTQYIEISNMGKLAGLRKHAEVLVRKILDIGNSQKLMLGQIRKNSDNKAVMRAMNNLGGELSEEIIKIINNINPLGRDGTHTQHTEEFSNEEVEGVEDAILDLYALMFIRYFQNIRISLYSEPQVLSMFSLLPPVIRYKTWNYLFEKDRNNIQVVNKLCLSIIKLFDKETAYQWLEENREIIKAIPYPNAKEIEKYNKINSFEIAPGVYHVCVSLDFEQYENIYDLLYAKISDRKTSINESGKMYKNFEEAIEHYNREIKNYSKTLDKEFYDLMDFVYIGRRSVEDLK
jgi:hypothetical protein